MNDWMSCCVCRSGGDVVVLTAGTGRGAGAAVGIKSKIKT
jgi:tRNA(Met) C34 N-acetyltransferase TmcA